MTTTRVRIATIRASIGISTGELARRAGVNPGTLYYIEDGTIKDPKLSTLRKLAAGLHVSVEYLISGKDRAA